MALESLLVYSFFNIEDKLVPKFPKKRASAPPPPEITVYESTVSNYSEIAMHEAIQKIYAKTNDIGGDDPKFMKQRIVDALLTQLNDNNHMILMVGEDMQPSWKETACSRRDWPW